MATADHARPMTDEELAVARGLVIEDIVDDDLSRQRNQKNALSNLLVDFAKYLRDDTDTFDPVMVSIAIENGNLKPDGEMIDDWVVHFVSTLSEDRLVSLTYPQSSGEEHEAFSEE